MKWIFIYFFSTLLLAATSVHASQDIEKKLSSVKLFSLGFNGFVAKKMPQQLIYEEALKDNNSNLIFKKILHDPTSTPESKAYAACGLWKNNQLKELTLNETFLNKEVTVLKGDILRKENLGEIFNGIKSHGCN